jgi:hypothetical protein
VEADAQLECVVIINFIFTVGYDTFGITIVHVSVHISIFCTNREITSP